tara:strand:+ start:4291 stop:4617 length:327 start_codon:yes stop_codon:yes gene_type:complete
MSDSLYNFENAVDEKRFYSLIKEIRCPKCTSGSLASSNAPVSQDIKNKIIELIKEGKSDKEIKEYIASRFGSSVLYNPGFNKDTYILWFAPFLILLIALSIYLFRRKA